MNDTFTFTSKSGKTYELTTKDCDWKTRGRWVTDAEGRVVIDEAGNAVTEGGGDDIVELRIDGKHVGRYSGSTEAEITKKITAAAKRYVATAEADAEWFPRCKAVAANFRYSDTDTFGTGAGDFFVGQKVAVWGHNGGRVGLVEKVGKKNVGVIYVVASSGAMWRKSMPFDKVAILDKPQSADEELAELTAAQVQGYRQQIQQQHQAQDDPTVQAADSSEERFSWAPPEPNCIPTGDQADDGRDYLRCGSIANPAGFCCEHGTQVGPQAVSLTDEQADAAAGLAHVLNQYLLSDLAGKLTCTEAEVVAEFVTAFHGKDCADEFLAAHAEEDEEGDMHYVEPAAEFDDDSHLAQYDDDPNPYHGTYSEA